MKTIETTNLPNNLGGHPESVRIFQGHETRQVDHNGASAQPDGWYWEPADYVGDTLWSRPYPTEKAVTDAVVSGNVPA